MITTEAANMHNTEASNLRSLEANPNDTWQYYSKWPTDDVHADRLGSVLQQHCGKSLKELHLNYRTWTKWGAHEIAAYLQDTSCLERLVFKHHQHPINEEDDDDDDDEGESTMSSTRTLACLLEAVAINPHGSIKSLGFHSVTLEGKSLNPFCQILCSTLSIKELILHKGLTTDMQSGDYSDKVASAFQANKSLQEMSFSRVPGPFLSFLLNQLAVECPPRLKALKFNNPYQQVPPDLEMSGLESLLRSPKCHLELLQFSFINLDRNNTEALLRGLLDNTTVRDISFQMSCSFDEEILERILSETTCLQRLHLYCGTQSTDGPIRALQNNTSITKCELTGLTAPFGAALRDVLTNNRTIRCLTLVGLAMLDQEPTPDNNIQLLAEGLRINNHIVGVCLDKFQIGDKDSLQYLAQALCPPPEIAQISPMDLSITSDEIVDVRLLYFSEVLRMPGCRLRAFTCVLRPSISHEGLVSLLQALEENQSVESLQIASPDNARFLGDWTVMQAFSKSLPKIKSLKKLELDFGMDREARFNPRGFLTIRSDLLAGLAMNSSLEHLQFGHEMYRSRTPREKGFWTRLSFYGMRNQLRAWLATQDDDHASLMSRLDYAKSITKEQLRTEKPWKLPVWRGLAKRTNELNTLSLEYICLRHVPHQLGASLTAA